MPSLCGDSSLKLVENGIIPLCFIDIIIFGVLNLFLLVFGIRRILQIRNISHQDIPITRNHLVRCCVLICVSLLHFIENIGHVFSQSSYLYQYLSNAGNSLAWIFVLYIVRMEYGRGYKSGWVIRVWTICVFVLNSLAFQSAVELKNRGHKNELDLLIQCPILIMSGVLALFATFAEQTPEGYARLQSDTPQTYAATRANFFSFITFHWMWPLLKIGRREPLQFRHLPSLDDHMMSSNVSDEFEKQWKMETQRERPSLWWAIFRTYKRDIILSGVYKMCTDACQIVGPSMLFYIVQFVALNRRDVRPSEEQSHVIKGLSYALVIFVGGILQSIFINQQFYASVNVGIQIKTALTNVVYKKSFHLSSKSHSSSSVGEMVNLQAIDAHKFIDLMPFVHVLWGAPLMIVVVLSLLYTILGYSAVAGIVIMLSVVPINSQITRAVRSLHKEVMENRDKRVEATNEVLNGIRIIKLFAWESSFSERIVAIRQTELALKKKIILWIATGFVMFVGSPIFVSLGTFGVYTLTGNQLTAEKAFTALALFGVVKMPLTTLPNVIATVMETKVSVDRLTKFLLMEEIDPEDVDRQPVSRSQDTGILIEYGTWNWDVDNLQPVLQDIHLKIPKGKLTAVVGAVGAGKTSLLSAILGLVPKTHGHVYGSLAYAAQTAWIQNATVKDNILFGMSYDAERYKRIIRVCELEQDLRILPDGDDTEIGEKGINLSGGQKQRISLARSVYQDRDIYLLDDPLSAVDAHVGKNIFDKCICEELSLKTRVLVTHQIQYVNQAELIVEGKISEMGTYEELMTSGKEFHSLIKTHVRTEEETTEGRDVTKEENVLRKSMKKSKDDEENEPTKLIKEEARETGSVGFALWKVYIKSVNSPTLLVCSILFQIIECVSRLSNDLWLSSWSNSSSDASSSTSSDDAPSSPSHSNTTYLIVYALLGVITVCMVWLKKYVTGTAALRAAKTLHDNILDKIMHAPTWFFDTTPVGRILNVFSRDVTALDDTLPAAIEMVIGSCFNNLITFSIICYLVPTFISALLPLCYVYQYASQYYLSSSRELKRLDSISKSPIYAQFSETLYGHATIRAFNRQTAFIEKNYVKVDNNNVAFFSFVTAGRWLGIRLDMIAVFVTTFTAASCILSREYITPGSAGLLLSYSLNIVGLLNMLVRSMTDAEAQMVSVERVYGYTKVETEAPMTRDKRPHRDWPKQGAITFSNVQARYREGLDLVLKGVDLQIHPREKIGVVGRTGAGKSSLMLALFRIIELSGGSIVIDGEDISTLGLEDVRRRLAIIPQDPTLFTGTIRSNLDPFSEHDDVDIWRALSSVQLQTMIENYPGKLDSKVTEGGENLSVGTRQLMCLARAILRGARVIVMDEATAAVDFETDSLIQHTIRKEFKDTTVLTIAHRLKTVLDYDRILVMDKGRVAEFDTPSNLLQNDQSIFFSMVNVRSGRS
ncbi:hypothetical protein PROFUN_03326 [Planoprotostelium fungivorum]|uniref:Uncharacterized protein n=1 Tax=Planoprotostelium fungivorum TaxID=1890364 RepID=A0A2P6NWS0_9EUKA|nr:hypothetical protein PROFUN_03326 [Planoprotostelium fungivorum]